ncbi:MAG: Lrp/AsnC family transcriptional regulator [Ignavibacteriaceae bacterium]|nr:Lrp/AsnC family transcriptional regulator [Ignavibacteriaceae bacterium]
MRLDGIDKKILDVLQSDAYITNVELASKLGISPPAMLERVKRLEKNGVIKGYVALVDPEKVGKPTFALVSVSLAVHQLTSIEIFAREINKLPEVLECHHVTGAGDFILKVALENIQRYEKFVLEKLTRIKGVDKITTMFILSTIKQTTKIQIE